MSKEKLAIFGSTGSIGTQALEILSHKTQLFHISVLTANNNYRDLAKQVNHFKPDVVVLGNEKYKRQFLELLTHKPSITEYGSDALISVAEEYDYDFLLNSLVGFSGFFPTYHALKREKKIALANKESLVVGGELLTAMPAFKKGNLIPVDSEHSAMLQCLVGEKKSTIKKIIITASGGPFRQYTEEEMQKITVEDALRHPNWDMGAKITIDSSTMMNKGLEIIEAKWMFNLPVEKIEPVIHPQSIIHSIIEFVDGSSKAQLGPPDMKVPILYALTYPERVSYPNQTLDYTQHVNMEIYPVDFKKFPCLGLSIQAAKAGGFQPAVLNAANEIAVERFLKKEIRYIHIPEIIKLSLNNIKSNKEITSEALLHIDKETREFANNLLV
ncbi:MAG: 1-deoxy-D-xylulose-5-phosphate reductoisomerase [Balneolaceae bacterium]|nr:MAG: 1-deoxy-D-xylulose-5-phosphate reductoisomerase [Balneolaceae bacterium]